MDKIAIIFGSTTGMTEDIVKKFVGLALDDTNESNKTDERINRWIKSLVI